VIIDRMPLADLGNPVAIARAVLQQLVQPVIPTPLDEIAVAVGITEITDHESTAFEGALLTDSNKMSGAILCKKGTLKERRRFTIGHELGHYLNQWHVPSGGGFECTKAQMLAANPKGATGRSKWEGEANEFAAELLMPSSKFNAEVRKIRKLEIPAIARLAERYEVSKLACARRIVGLGQEDCAAISSKDGRIEAIYRSEEFPFIPLRIGMELPTKCRSKTFQGEVGDVSALDDSEISLWSDRKLTGSQYFEQVLLQEGGWRLTLLICEREDEDDAESSQYSHRR